MPGQQGLAVAEYIQVGLDAYSAEDDRLFRRNMTGYSADSVLVAEFPRLKITRFPESGAT